MSEKVEELTEELEKVNNKISSNQNLNIQDMTLLFLQAFLSEEGEI